MHLFSLPFNLSTVYSVKGKNNIFVCFVILKKPNKYRISTFTMKAFLLRCNSYYCKTIQSNRALVLYSIVLSNCFQFVFDLNAMHSIDIRIKACVQDSIETSTYRLFSYTIESLYAQSKSCNICGGDRKKFKYNVILCENEAYLNKILIFYVHIFQKQVLDEVLVFPVFMKFIFQPLTNYLRLYSSTNNCNHFT